MERMVLTLCKQNSSKTAETICILTTENCLWLLLEVREANIQFIGFTRRCHCSQLPELENDTKMNAFIRRLLSEELNGIIFHKAKCLLTLGKRCWSCWKVTAQLEKVPQASVLLINVFGTGEVAFKIGFYWKVVSERLFDRSTERAESDQCEGVKPRSILRDWCACSRSQSAVCLFLYGSLSWLKFYTAPK